MLMQFGPHERSAVKISKNLKIQDGDGGHLKKSKNRRISATF